ncbi:MAG: hypothetical protein JNL82_35010 [Myxococcales bacterium]|nr:hypothetical protein [Myxococcales bacterium]
MDSEGPRTIGEFEVVRLVGASAVGPVYRAFHRDNGRSSYVRVLDRAYTADAEAVALLVGEPHIVLPRHVNLGGECMYDASVGRGRVGERVFHVFSTAHTLDLETVARAAPLPWPEVRWRLLDICCGLAAAHAVGIVHGDLQPGHCFELASWDEPGPRTSVRVTGFGLAEARRRGLQRDHPANPYLAPEQLAGAAPDARSDVWAAAMTMLHLLLGRPPPTWRPGAVYRDPATDADLPTAWPRGVDALLAVALAPDPGDRHASMRELAAAIAAIDGGDVAGALARFDPAPPPVRRVWADLPFAELRQGGVFVLIMLLLWLVFSP